MRLKPTSIKTTIGAQQNVEHYIESEKHLPWVTSYQNEEENAVNMTRMGFETLEALENLQM